MPFNVCKCKLGRTVFDVVVGSLEAGILGSNLAQGMGFRRLSVLHCTVQVDALLRADYLSKESFHVLIDS